MPDAYAVGDELARQVLVQDALGSLRLKQEFEFQKSQPEGDPQGHRGVGA